jgi:hypothetical protein
MVSPGFVTDGMDRETATLVDTCLRHRIVINALDNEGLLSGGADSPESLGQFQGPRADWAERSLGQRNLIVQGFMVDATESTGGEFIHNNNDLNRGLEALTAVPPVSYMLGISPAEQPDGKYHKLKVTVTKPGNYDVSARPGYFQLPARSRPRLPGSVSTVWRYPPSLSPKSLRRSKFSPSKIKMTAIAFKSTSPSTPRVWLSPIKTGWPPSN